MSAKGISDELVRRVTADLRDRYRLDDEDLRALGARLADEPQAVRRDENLRFADGFTREHRDTFDRLAE